MELANGKVLNNVPLLIAYLEIDYFMYIRLQVLNYKSRLYKDV